MFNTSNTLNISTLKGVQYTSPGFQPREQGTYIRDKTYFALKGRDNNRIT